MKSSEIASTLASITGVVQDLAKEVAALRSSGNVPAVLPANAPKSLAPAIDDDITTAPNVAHVQRDERTKFVSMRKADPIMLGKAPTADFTCKAQTKGSGMTVSGTANIGLDNGGSALCVDASALAKCGVYMRFGYPFTGARAKDGASPVYMANSAIIEDTPEALDALVQLAKICAARIKARNAQ
jgi:hypothetical protein